LLQGVIFDIDGTLVDSNDTHAKSWVDTFAKAGYDVPFDVVRPLQHVTLSLLGRKNR